MFVTGSIEQIHFLARAGRFEEIDSVFFLHPTHAFYAGLGDAFVYFRTPIVFLKDVAMPKSSLLQYNREVKKAVRDYERASEQRGGIIGYDGSVVTLQGDHLYFDRMKRNDYEFNPPPFEAVPSRDKVARLIDTYLRLFASTSDTSILPHMKIDLRHLKRDIIDVLRKKVTESEWYKEARKEAPTSWYNKQLVFSTNASFNSVSVRTITGEALTESLKGIHVGTAGFEELLTPSVFNYLKDLQETMMINGVVTITFCPDEHVILESRDEEGKLLYLARHPKNTFG